ncbi:MAG: cardiolipin hydrolase [Myxococcota bacterium]|jgi:cardiolipin hydrolase
MRDEAIDKALAETFEDRRLSRGERKAMKALVDSLPRPGDARHRFRARAFLMAMEHVKGGRAEEAVDWLEDLTKALWPSSSDVAAGQSPSEAHFSPEGDPAGRIIRLLDKSRKSLDICVFTITDNRVTAAVIKAFKRGVALRVVTDNDKAGDRGSDVERLIDAGIPVAVDVSDHHMHHKFAIADRHVLLNGSYNWTRSASKFNQENVSISSDATLVSAYQREFDRLWSLWG